MEDVPQIRCTDEACWGNYIGPEFIEGDDVAHQFSNKMAARVGDELKAFHRAGLYSKVDFAGIRMTTSGMGSGEVEYELYIPFVRVDSPCEAYTSFDHCGGWDHKPALMSRIAKLKTLLMRGDRLKLSPLMKTPEGLQEYWIQWRHKEVQADCAP